MLPLLVWDMQKITSWNNKKNIKHALPFWCVLIFSMPIFAYANPVLDHIVSGSASVQQTSNSTIVNQISTKAIINWQSFNIGSQETTHFAQPAGGVAFNGMSLKIVLYCLRMLS